MKIIGHLCLLFSASFLFGAESLERTFEKSLEVEPGFTFSLDAHKGTIRIRTDSSSTLQIKARYYIDPSQISDHEKALESLDNFEVALRTSGKFVHVDGRRKKSWKQMMGGWNNDYPLPRVDFDIIMPDDAGLKIDTHKAKVDVHAPSGPVEIESHKGSGTILGVRDDLDIDTHKGNFKVTIELLHDLRIDTHKGDIMINVVEARNFSLYGNSHKGQLHFVNRDIHTKRDKNGETTVSYEEGSADHRVRLSTHKGDITMAFKNE